MKKIVFITANDAEYGFGLAGVTQLTATAEQAEDLLNTVLAEADTGLVVMDERLIKHIADEKLKELEARWHGILLVLPSPEKAPPEEENYALRLIRRAIGYHVRLQG
ncbi:MAG: ATPase [Deltaproteobacteria bacterium]|nr:ATPase [Deltaproteobacteria bacterium]